MELEQLRQLDAIAREGTMSAAADDVARRTRALRVGTVAPAPLWRLTALMIERFPGLVLTSQTLAEAQVESGIHDGELDLGIALRPAASSGVRSSRLMAENLSVALPVGHALADRSSVSAAELDGETFLLFEGIGFWREACDRHFPHSRFIVQEDRAVFEQMARSSSLPHFVTDAPSLAAPAPGRTVVPIRDAMAHATFHLLVRDGGRREADEVFDWVRGRPDPAS